MNEHRRVSLFRNGRNQAVRIPVGFELPGEEAIMRKEGDRLVIEPVAKQKTLLEVLDNIAARGPSDEFPDIDDHLPMREIDL